MVAPGARFELDGGRLHVVWPELASLLDLVACCRLAGGQEHLSESWQLLSGGESGPAVLRSRSGPLGVELRLDFDGDRLRTHLLVEAVEAAEVAEFGLAGRPVLPDSGAQCFLFNGYQSWSPAGRKLLDAASTPARLIPLESWWTAGLALQSGVGLAVATDSYERWGTRFELEAGDLAALCSDGPGIDGRPLPWRVRGGETASSALTWVAGRSVDSALAQAVGKAAAAPAPRGWLSWYHYGAWVDRGDVLENTACLAEGPLAGLGYEVVQIDDGWQSGWGDWRPNARFGSSLKELTVKLAGAGFRPGIWTAPFLVDPQSELGRRAPDRWFLTHPNGERAIDPMQEGNNRYFQVLDLRQLEVLRHLEATFAELRDAGFDYFKIDFLYAGAYAGVAALREGLLAIRRGVGRGSYLLACGAPLGPIRGLVEGCRIGIDTCTPLLDTETAEARPVFVDDEIRSVARNLAWRHFLEGWYQLDPDVALAGGNISLDEARQLVTVVALAGGPFFLSDRLSALAAERRELLSNPEVLDLVGGPAFVPDWAPVQADLPPVVWRRGEDSLAVFNWSQRAQSLSIELPGRWRLRDLWARADAGVVDGALELDLPPAGVRLLKLTRA
ncbi:MAG TPA: alpha-galactosidase [Candidatus Acidoferrales bacterium]|nr:alpha-galactosidase [Candidatus Acidoferrales bacterium]